MRSHAGAWELGNKHKLRSIGVSLCTHHESIELNGAMVKKNSLISFSRSCVGMHTILPPLLKKLLRTRPTG